MWRQYWTITVINHLQWALWLGKVSVVHLLWRRTFVMLDLWSLLNKYFAFGSNKANMNLFLIENYSGLGIKLLNISFWTEKKIYWLSSDCDNVRKSVVCESIRPAIFKAFSTKLWWIKSYVSEILKQQNFVWENSSEHSSWNCFDLFQWRPLPLVRYCK